MDEEGIVASFEGQVDPLVVGMVVEVICLVGELCRRN